MIQRACYVSCDVCGDPAESSCYGADDARRVARVELGYVRKRIDGKWCDLCPRHTTATILPDGKRFQERPPWDAAHPDSSEEEE